jgi:hypothetical protein
VGHSRDGDVEFPVEGLGSGLGNGAWFWASGRSRFAHGLLLASGLESAGLRIAPWQRCPKIGSAQSAVSHGCDFGDRIALAAPEVGVLLPD